MTATIASPIPVLPDVPSIIVPPGFNFPSRSASSIIRTAIRSLIELPGLNVSSLTRTSASINPRVMLCTRTIGVLPMASRMVSQIFRTGGAVTIESYVDCTMTKPPRHKDTETQTSKLFTVPLSLPGACREGCDSEQPLMRHAVDDVVHAQFVGAAGDIDGKSFIRRPLPVLRDVAVV